MALQNIHLATKLDKELKREISIEGKPFILRHASDFIARRLAPADPPNDGNQTPMRGHPVFIAQRATATCCRGCLAKWHNIPQGNALTTEERAHVIGASHFSKLPKKL